MEDVLSRKFKLLIPGFFLLFYILPLGFRPIFIPDESRYAEIPREMIASGDWVVPRLDGIRYFEKPVLGYWLNAISIKMFGENAFAVRFPSAMATGLSAFIIFLLIRRFSNRNFLGAITAVIFLTCFEV
jgi:4-amino-4-deoxy-L-arabinose transferase